MCKIIKNQSFFCHQISECCSTIRLEYEDFETLVYQKYPYLFTDFEKESDSLNGKAHYTSKDGKYAISYNSCQQWVITILEVHGRYVLDIQCFSDCWEMWCHIF